MKALPAVILLLVLSVAVLPLTAQEGCPAVVQTALDAAKQACGTLGRNEACYGNTLVSATGWNDNSLNAFVEPGNIISLFDLKALATAPLDAQNNNWGVALLSLQANIPDSLPGQNVTFLVFGDAQLENDVSPDETELPVTLIGTTVGSPNVRTAPSTGADLLVTLGNGESVQVIGRTQGGNWYQIIYQSAARWVNAEFLQLDSDRGELPIVPREEWTNPLLKYTAPMQAFRIETGLRGTECEDVPESGVVVQAPANTTVNFMVNGVEMSVGSTAMLRLDESETGLEVATLGGTIGLKSADVLAIVEPGNISSVTEGSPPTEPERYQYDDVRSLPVDLLPEPVTLLPPDGTQASVFACNFTGNTLRTPVSADKPIIFAEGLGSGTAESAAQVRELSAVTLTMDGQNIPLWDVSEPYEKSSATFTAEGQQAGSSILYDWWFVVPEPEPGEHDLVLTWTYQETFSYTCSIVVE
ncbi:MAG: SH3 domain-containing protein [Anaerolineae bacterium]|nr:SH3 domain-containing protein [Anaerolineae bacterium]